MHTDQGVARYLDVNGQPIASPTKHRILDTAVDLFSQRGYSGTSIRDITKQVGIKESSLYKHFTNKESMLETIFYYFRREVAKIVPPLSQLDWILANMTPEAFLERGVQNFMNHIADPVIQKIWRIVFIEQYRDPLARDIYFQDMIGKTTDFLEIVFVKWVAAGKIRPFNPKVMAVSYQYPLFTMSSEFIMLMFEGKDTAVVERRIADHVAFFCSVIKM